MTSQLAKLNKTLALILDELRGQNKAADFASMSNEAEDWPSLADIEGRYVQHVQHHTKGNKQAAARLLSVDRKTLDRMIKRHHLESV